MRELFEIVSAEIEREGFMPFARFMELALYTPGLGYYAGGAQKFGARGDFVTAPALTPLFGRALAVQLEQWLNAGCDSVLELGAGDGTLAADILAELERRGHLPQCYQILEVSAELRARQHATLARTLPHLLERVEWRERLPGRFEGVLLGNEVLDALPVALVSRRRDGLYERGVALDPQTRDLAWSERPAHGELLEAAAALDLPRDYTTEVHLAARALVRTLGESLASGAMLFIDFGFPAHEYYHPQRCGGTLMCHRGHRAYTDPLAAIGAQDITSHLDFSALAEAGAEAGLDLIGYSDQASFLIDCGILDGLAALGPTDSAQYARAASAVQKLLSPAEMGELFKAIAFGRGIDAVPLGFRRGDRSARL